MNPKDLLEKLPSVRGWIDRTLAVMAYELQDYFEKAGRPINIEAAVRLQLDGFIPALERAFK